MLRASLTAHNRSCRREELLTRIPWFLRRWNHIQTKHTVRGRPRLKVVKRFREGSVCKAYERSAILRANILSEFIKNHLMPKELAINRGYRLLTLIKSIFRSVIVFLDVIVNQVGSQHELITSEKQEQKVQRICFCCLRMYLFEYT